MALRTNGATTEKIINQTIEALKLLKKEEKAPYERIALAEQTRLGLKPDSPMTASGDTSAGAGVRTGDGSGEGALADAARWPRT